ncbi:MAG: hypothetical protein OXD36_11835 [Rhodobacter sp.]|nr:hypothetical protein [Rhodobacter sp.]
MLPEHSASGATYNAVWDGLLEVARARRYFAAQERRLERLVNALRFVLALSGVGAVASLVDSLPLALAVPLPLGWLAPVSGAAVAALVIVDLSWGGAVRVARLKVANVELAGLETGYRSFWEKTRNGAFSDGEAQSMKDEMLDALNRIAAHVDVTPNDSIVLRTQDAAFTAEEQRYAV